jgi:membrane-associated HD superfamily phosphohydrolase
VANQPYQQIAKLQRILTEGYVAKWLHVDVYNWHFWFIIALLIVQWPLWYKLADKSSFQPIFLFCMFYMILNITLDAAYTSIPLLIYPFLTFPLLPWIITLDYTIIPMIFTLIYQRYALWKSFLATNYKAAAVISFIGEALASLTGFYFIIKWNYFCPFPNFIVMSIIAKWLADELIAAARSGPQQEVGHEQQ